MPKISTLRTRLILSDFTSRLRITQLGDTTRIRGTTLQNIRKKHFEFYPLCAICLAATPPRTRAAVELDHITPLHLGGQESEANRQGLCIECHNEKTIRERGETIRKPGGR